MATHDDLRDDEYRAAIEAADLPAGAIPTDAFFGEAADREAVRAAREAYERHAARVEELREEHERVMRDAEGTRPKAEPGRPLRIGVLISGSGTNLQAIIDRIAAGTLHDVEIAMVVSSRPSAKGLQRAEAAGLQTLTLSKEIYEDPIAADEVIASELLRNKVDYVIMAGYMRMVHGPLLATFPNRVVNLHPALLPSFQGAHAIDDAYERGVKVTGVTVHFANEVYDQGPIIAQRPVAVREGWTRDELEAAIHEVEHELYPEVVQMLADGRVHVDPDGIHIRIDA